MSKVVFIAGATRSGTTLADILIGNLPGYFSCGELMYFSLNGLSANEYCACGQHVLTCNFWKQVASIWDKRRVLTIEEYNRIYFHYLKNKSILRFLFRLRFPDEGFKIFKQDTLRLYESIWEVNQNKIIIDSSKSPYRILLLKSIGLRVEVVHLIRELRGVLFSAEKELKRDAKAGIEIDIRPKKPLWVSLKWLYVNLLVAFFAKGLKRSVILFEELLESPVTVIKTIFEVDHEKESLYKAGGPFNTGHIVAGGRIRMQEYVYIKSEVLKKERWQGRGFVNMIVSILEKKKWK